MDFTKIIWELFSLLFQGCIAGLIVLFCTLKFKRYDEESLCKKHALLVYLEIKYHLSIFDEILNEQRLSYLNTSSPLILENWKDSKRYLTSMPLEDFEKIASYYQVAADINSLLVSITDQSSISFITSVISRVKSHAETTSKILYDYHHK